MHRRKKSSFDVTKEDQDLKKKKTLATEIKVRKLERNISMLLQSVSMSSQKIRFVTVVCCHKQDTSLAKHHRRDGHRTSSGRSKIWISRRRRCSSGKGGQLGLPALALMVTAVASATDTHMLTSTGQVLTVAILKGNADAIASVAVEHVLA